MNTNELISIIEEGDYDVYGIRIDATEYSVNDTMLASRMWCDGEPVYAHEYTNDEGTAETLIEMGYEEVESDEDERLFVNRDAFVELDGTSAVTVTADTLYEVIAFAQSVYPEGHVYLIGGEYAGSGEDEGEVIISEATVLAIL